MARSLSIAAFLAGLGSSDQPKSLQDLPPRPKGVIIWARCSEPSQVTAVENLNRKLREDGDEVLIIATVTAWDNSIARRALPEPQGKDNIRGFIAHWRPAIVIWMRRDLDPIILNEVLESRLLSIFVDASAEGLEMTAGSWVPGAMRTLLSQFDAVLALDQIAAERLIRAGARESMVRVTGAMEDCAPPLPCSEDERQQLAAAIGTRPVWLAAAADVDECYDLCAAHVAASRRAHRLLLIVTPRNTYDAAEIAETMRDAGLQVALRSDEYDPHETTQVYVIDTEEELGLFYRISPITYLGGTLYGAPCRDPFEPATLGSAVLYGPRVAPFERHATRLNAAGASSLIRSSADLGAAVETLLAADKAAEQAHAAWDVTSRGADVTHTVAELIQRRLAGLGY